MFRSLPNAVLFLVAAAATAVGQTAPTPTAAAAYAPAFRSGHTYVGPRLWLGNLHGAVAVGAQVERGLTQPQQYGPGIVAGGFGIDYYTWNYSFQPVGQYSYSVVPVQLFGNYHFLVEGMPKLDPYLGVALVYSIVSASWSGGAVGSAADASSLGFAGQGGARYFVSDKLAIQGQIGFGYGTLSVGAAWRF
jgi:hypothetical protein